MEDQSQPKILVVGAGAIGAFYGACLHKAGGSVSAVCRSDHEAVAEKGFVIASPLGDLSFKPAAVLRTVAEVREAPDYLLLCVKVIDGLNRAELIRPAIGPNTVIVLIENGLGVEAELAQAYPDNILLSAVAYVAVSREAKGKIRHFNDGRLMLGEFPAATGEAANQLSALFAVGGIKARVVESITRERWRKCVWNAVLNTVSVLADGADTTTMVTAPGGEDLLRGMLGEVCAVAAEAGYPMPPEMIDKGMESVRDMPPYQTSMALDWLHGRPLELDAILGEVLTEARRLGVQTPQLDCVYSLIRMRLWQRRNSPNQAGQ